MLAESLRALGERMATLLNYTMLRSRQQGLVVRSLALDETHVGLGADLNQVPGTFRVTLHKIDQVSACVGCKCGSSVGVPAYFWWQAINRSTDRS